jgi:hypothetical protein
MVGCSYFLNSKWLLDVDYLKISLTSSRQVLSSKNKSGMNTAEVFAWLQKRASTRLAECLMLHILPFYHTIFTNLFCTIVKTFFLMEITSEPGLQT